MFIVALCKAKNGNLSLLLRNTENKCGIFTQQNAIHQQKDKIMSVRYVMDEFLNYHAK